MNYKIYKEYKESNSDWIGLIPVNWNISRLKFLVEIITGSTPSKSDDRYYINGTFPWVKPDDLKGLIPINSSNILINNEGKRVSRIVPKDSVLVCCIGSLGKIGVAGTKLATNQQINALIPNNLIINDFCKYMIVASSSEYEKYANSNVVAIINKQQQGELTYPVPSLEEQKQIANYLDKQTTKIDETLVKNQKLIQLLEEKRITLINQVVTKGLNPDIPMKDSGVELIGEIPEHWDVEKLKNISKVIPSNVDKKSKNNEPSVLLCNYTDVYNNEFITMDLDFMKATATPDQIKKLSLNIDDIIITKDSESVDDIAVPAIVTEKLENVVCGYHLSVIKPNTNIVNPKFLFRIFESDRINKQFELGANGVTRFGLGTYPINNAWLCLPPLGEQKEIAVYIDTETSKIFKSTDKIIKHNELLEEYKTSLIHNVVTGKVDVRGEEI